MDHSQDIGGNGGVPPHLQRDIQGSDEGRPVPARSTPSCSNSMAAVCRRPSAMTHLLFREGQACLATATFPDARQASPSWLRAPPRWFGKTGESAGASGPRSRPFPPTRGPLCPGPRAPRRVFPAGLRPLSSWLSPAASPDLRRGRQADPARSKIISRTRPRPPAAEGRGKRKIRAGAWRDRPRLRWSCGRLRAGLQVARRLKPCHGRVWRGGFRQRRLGRSLGMHTAERPGAQPAAFQGPRSTEISSSSAMEQS